MPPHTGVLATFFQRLWESDEVIAVIVAALLSLVGGILIRIFTPRGKLAWGVSHQHAFYLQHLQPPTLVYTKELWIQNVGRASVENIEVILASPPNHFDIWPQRNFTRTQNPNGNLIITVDSLSRGEYFTLSMFNITLDTPPVTNVRWSGGVGQQRPMAPQQVLKPWQRRLGLALVLFGVFSLLYFLVRGLVAIFLNLDVALGYEPWQHVRKRCAHGGDYLPCDGLPSLCNSGRDPLWR